MALLLLALPQLLLLAALLPAAEVFNANVASRDLAPEVSESQMFQATVRVRNPYDRAVKIARIDTSCHCSRLEPVSRFLLPGEVTELHVEAPNLLRSGPQDVRISLFTSDPDFSPIEVQLWWRVREHIAVDALPVGAPTDARPADTAWRDVYRYLAHERPDEPQRLKKRIRLSCPPGEVPDGGLRVEGIDYPGTIWRFEARAQDDGSVLILARARDLQAVLPPGSTEETVLVRTNHPAKPTISLSFQTVIDHEAGKAPADPLAMDPMNQPMRP
jgi:hypothetical protein